MCGIVGAVAHQPVAQVLLDGLSRLEYRGYDSAGLALIHANGHLFRLRRAGKVSALREAFTTDMDGCLGIAHTRWATHGLPSESNAHPHFSHEQIAVVHNGIIENHQTLRGQLTQAGYVFTSDTDTEVVAHLIHQCAQASTSFLAAVHQACTMLKGAYALAVISLKERDKMIAVRQGSPLVIGIGDTGHYLASDMGALLTETQRFIYLEDGDMVEMSQSQVNTYDQTLKRVSRPIHTTDQTAQESEKGVYRHFMQKEIFSQPAACQRTIDQGAHCKMQLADLFGPQAKQILERTERIQLIACGTSYHASLCTQQWIESRAGIPCKVCFASEFAQAQSPVEKNTLLMAMSQSGETADTISAFKLHRHKYLACLAISNVEHSTLIRESELSFLTQAGPEIGVAASKTFSTQLIAGLLLSQALKQIHNKDNTSDETFWSALHTLPNHIARALNHEKAIMQMARQLSDSDHAIFIGRGIGYPIALEGALKLKEISYLHADAYPAGELKHGPLALIDKHMPVIVCAFADEAKEKLKANIEEIQAREGQVFYVASNEISWPTPHQGLIAMEPMPELIQPIVYNVPLQLLAYHVAVLKGTDVDQPRNLAKSVTVE